MADEQRPGDAPVGIFATPELALARQKLEAAAARHTSTVTYVSGGHALVIGAPEAALAAAERLRAAGASGATLVHVDPGAARIEKALTEDGVALFTVATLALEGHLGAFSAVGSAAGAEADLAVSVRRPEARFDLVLDLSPEPAMAALLPPPGYAHASTEGALAEAVESLGGLVGEFDKPRYFAYDAAICAHSRSRLVGCSNCLDVCVTGAISSAGEGVVVDPFLCQGCGSCATLCPTGAMVYAYPKPSDAIARTRAALADGGQTTLVLHAEAAQAAVDAAALPDDALALLVEEVSAFGIDYWATVLCAGVGRILLVVDAPAAGRASEGQVFGGVPTTDGTAGRTLVAGDAAERDRNGPNRRALEDQAALLRRLVAGLGVGPEVIQLVPPEALADLAALPGPVPILVGRASAPFATHDDERQTVRTALDTLDRVLAPAVEAETGAPPAPVEPLPAGAPFGHILVDQAACTLCMACVSTCPAGALLDGQESPALRLVEANCVQCGLCESACPENAITLEARYLRDGVAARRVRTLNEETPFHCVVCHKPFATRRMIDTMLGKLAGHWMFEDERARRRLKMCEDCRVRDIFDTDPQGLDVHAGPAEDARGVPDGPKEPPERP